MSDSVMHLLTRPLSAFQEVIRICGLAWRFLSMVQRKRRKRFIAIMRACASATHSPPRSDLTFWQDFVEQRHRPRMSELDPELDHDLDLICCRALSDHHLFVIQLLTSADHHSISFLSASQDILPSVSPHLTALYIHSVPILKIRSSWEGSRSGRELPARSCEYYSF